MLRGILLSIGIHYLSPVENHLLCLTPKVHVLKLILHLAMKMLLQLMRRPHLTFMTTYLIAKKPSKDPTQSKDDRAIQYYLQVGAFSEESQADNLKRN